VLQPENFRVTIDSLNANVAILDKNGVVVVVNEGWRRFGKGRSAQSDYVGVNYVRVCEAAAERGDMVAGRIARGLRRLLGGQAESYGTVYRCAEHFFRMTVRPLVQPQGGVIVAHQKITDLLAARRDRDILRNELSEVRRGHLLRVEGLHEDLGQKLAAISLAAASLEKGRNVTDAVTIIRLAVEEARQELKLLRYEARGFGE